VYGNKEEENTVTCQDESRHGFQDGDYVTFTEVHGMTELNRCEPRQIKVLGERAGIRSNLVIARGVSLNSSV